MIAMGRLEVVDEGPPETVIRTLKRGDVLGELALLQEGRRSASVRAVRDTWLVMLGRGGLRGADAQLARLRARADAQHRRAARGQPLGGAGAGAART